MLFPFETGEMELTVSRCTRANVPKGGRVSGERRSGVGGQFVQLVFGNFTISTQVGTLGGLARQRLAVIDW